MRVRHEGVSILCPGCGKQVANTWIDRTMFEFRARRAAVSRLPVERLDEAVFESSADDSSDAFDSIWSGWLID